MGDIYDMISELNAFNRTIVELKLALVQVR